MQIADPIGYTTRRSLHWSLSNRSRPKQCIVDLQAQPGQSGVLPKDPLIKCFAAAPVFVADPIAANGSDVDMTVSKRRAAADKFRREIRRSNEFHTEYLNNADFLKEYDRFTVWQLGYLLPFFADLHEQEGYSEAIDFTMSDLAGVGISERDHDLERAAPAITRMLPLSALVTIAAAVETNARVLKVNIAICRCLLVDGALPNEISELDYCLACREASSLDECVELVHLITGLGATLKSLVKIPMLGITLRAMRGPAHVAGFGALHEFLNSGYTIFRKIPDIDHFLDQIEKRMTRMFEIIYTAPTEDLHQRDFVEQQAALLKGQPGEF